MTSPHSVQLEPVADARLAVFAARHAGLSHSGASALLVEEGLRMDAHPGILFREGPAGRRAVIVGGPDVWEAIRAIRAVRLAGEDVSGHAGLAAVEAGAGMNRRALEVAVAYYCDYPDEVDAFISDAEAFEAAQEKAERRRSALLRR